MFKVNWLVLDNESALFPHSKAMLKFVWHHLLVILSIVFANLHHLGWQKALGHFIDLPACLTLFISISCSPPQSFRAVRGGGRQIKIMTSIQLGHCFLQWPASTPTDLFYLFIKEISAWTLDRLYYWNLPVFGCLKSFLSCQVVVGLAQVDEIVVTVRILYHDHLHFWIGQDIQNPTLWVRIDLLLLKQDQCWWINNKSTYPLDMHLWTIYIYYSWNQSAEIRPKCFLTNLINLFISGTKTVKSSFMFAIYVMKYVYCKHRSVMYLTPIFWSHIIVLGISSRARVGVR